MSTAKSIFSLLLFVISAPFHLIGEIAYENNFSKKLVAHAASRKGVVVTLINTLLLLRELLYPVLTGTCMESINISISLTLTFMILYQLVALLIASCRKRNDDLGYSWYTYKLPKPEYFILEQWVTAIGTIIMWFLLLNVFLFLGITISLY